MSKLIHSPKVENGVSLGLFGLFYDFSFDFRISVILVQIRKTVEVQRKQEGFQGQKAIVIPRKIISNQCVGNPVNEPLYVTDIGYYPKARFHYRERPEGADQHIFIYCLEGRGEVVIAQNKYTIEAGDFFLVPSQARHQYAADENSPWTIYWMHFKGRTADEICKSFIKKNEGHKGFKHYTGSTIQLFDKIYNLLARGYSMDNLAYANMCLHQFFADFLFTSADTTNGNHKDTHELAIDFLNSRIDKLLTLEEIAATVNLSPSHFSFLFKKKTGFTPIEYFNHLKMQKACQYLLFTSLRVKEIALELGIEDQSYFSRLFTKVMGKSPNEYRLKRIH